MTRKFAQFWKYSAINSFVKNSFTCLDRDKHESNHSRCGLTKAGVDVGHRLIHGHVYETSAEAVMRKDEQHWLEQLVELVESLERESMWADRNAAKKGEQCILVILRRCPQKGPGWRWWRYCWCLWRGWCMTTRRRPCWGHWIWKTVGTSWASQTTYGGESFHNRLLKKYSFIHVIFQIFY